MIMRCIVSQKWVSDLMNLSVSKYFCDEPACLSVSNCNKQHTHSLQIFNSVFYKFVLQKISSSSLPMRFSPIETAENLIAFIQMRFFLITPKT